MSRERDKLPTVRAVVRGMTVGSLAARIGAELRGDGDVLVTGVSQDSRRVVPGDLFVALCGARSDGLRFVSPALAAGAMAVLVERGAEARVDVPVLEVHDPRRAMADAASEVYGRPTATLRVVGITGTNGKTTTAQLTAHALRAGGARVGVVGTLGYAFEDLAIDATHTSPEADALQRIARDMLDRGAEDLVMEVSSIALAAERVRAIRFDVAAFTNLTQDHLDYHGDMERYASEKDRLFFEHAPETCVVNVDDPHGARLAQALRGGSSRLITVSADGKPAIVRASDVAHTARGMSLTIDVAESRHVLESSFVGAHNAANLLMAVAIAHGLGRDVTGVMRALGEAPVVPGRLERCDDALVDDVVAVVDYAHTPDALTRVLASLRPLTTGRLVCVFGCGGDRDADKRRPMGAAVARAADVAIVTNDNPRSESPRAIAEAVVAGFSGSSVRYEVELDRRVAIERAIGEAQPGDVVLVAGKGHETYQIIGDQKMDFDDRDVVRAALKSRRRE